MDMRADGTLEKVALDREPRAGDDFFTSFCLRNWQTCPPDKAWLTDGMAFEWHDGGTLPCLPVACCFRP